MIAESGNYNDLLESGKDFKSLVAAHESSMELVEAESSKRRKTSVGQPTSPQASFSPRQENDDMKSQEQTQSDRGTSKLIKEEERETGKVSLHVYKLYCTESLGWWGVIAVLLISVLWQGSLMAGDYWLAYETSGKRAMSFNPSVFIGIYAIIAAGSFVLILIRIFLLTFMGLKTSQIFFKGILHSILHAPMSFFDTTPSGRILSRVTFSTLSGWVVHFGAKLEKIKSCPYVHLATLDCMGKKLDYMKEMFKVTEHVSITGFIDMLFHKILQASNDQTNIDVFVPLFTNFFISMYITLFGIIIITCQNAWPTVLLLIPLGWLNYWFRVCASFMELKG